MVRTCQIIALLISCLLWSGKAYAIELLFPVACRLMDTCWITKHVDLNNNQGKSEDYMCGKKADDNNMSTHISLGSLSATVNNVPILAPADGIVQVAENVGGFCGERVLINHGGGWETGFCHLKQDTLQVKEGQEVKRGDILGAIGMTGQTSWPHLSFAVLRNGMVFDPFSGRTSLEGCIATSQPMWIGGINPPYEPAHVTSVGFTVGQVSNQQVMTGSIKPASTIANVTPQISLWAMLMNIQKGDNIHLKIEEPSGRILNEIDIEAGQNREYYPIYFATRRKNFLWDAGRYKGTVTITRNVNTNDITVGKYTHVQLVEVN